MVLSECAEKRLLLVSLFPVLAFGCGDDGEAKERAVLSSYELATTVLTRAATEVCSDYDWLEGPVAGEDGVWFSCSDWGGHWWGARVIGLGTPAEAARAFSDASTGAEIARFHGVPLAVTPDGAPYAGDRNLAWFWRVGCWIVRVHVFDDTPFHIAVDPDVTSEAVYAAAVDADLFSFCLQLSTSPSEFNNAIQPDRGQGAVAVENERSRQAPASDRER
jgi:hypothetical protein